MNDPILIVHEFLSAPGTDLNTLVGDRIWSPIAPDGFQNTQPALIYHPDVQAPEAPMNVMVNSVVFKCYGGDGTFSKAREVAMRLYERLHMGRGTTASGKIIQSRCTLMQQAGYEPDTGWPIHVARFEVVTY
jgi:hypothetical protein